MAVNSNRLNLTRDQLAAFLKDPKSIKQFERLFASADATQPETIFEVAVSAGNGIAAANEAISRVSAVEQQVAALAAAPAVKPPESRRYGSFYSTVTQTIATINTATAMTFNNTDISFGVYVGAPTSRVYVDRGALYNIQFSAQLDNTAGGIHLAYIWLRINGIDVPYSAGQLRLKGNDGELIAAWNYLAQLNEGDYFELMWAAADTAVQILAESATAFCPAVPSVILTVTDNIGN
jgi:hypothetical protein